jgi:formate dehydrogenase subunit gamma
MRFSPWDPARAAAIATAEAGREGALLPILHALQAEFGCIPREALPIVAEILNLSRAEVHGVVSFYHDFRGEPPPARLLQLCRAEACQARGGEALAAAIEAKVAGRADVALEAVYCLGLCASGPAAMLNGRPYARLDAERVEQLLAEEA